VQHSYLLKCVNPVQSNSLVAKSLGPYRQCSARKNSRLPVVLVAEQC
jgi:hypothetical protein